VAAAGARTGGQKPADQVGSGSVTSLFSATSDPDSSDGQDNSELTNRQKVDQMKSEGVKPTTALGFIIPVIVIILGTVLWFINPIVAVITGLVAAGLVGIWLLVRAARKNKKDSTSGGKGKGKSQTQMSDRNRSGRLNPFNRFRRNSSGSRSQGGEPRGKRWWSGRNGNERYRNGGQSDGRGRSLRDRWRDRAPQRPANDRGTKDLANRTPGSKQARQRERGTLARRADGSSRFRPRSYSDKRGGSSGRGSSGRGRGNSGSSGGRGNSGSSGRGRGNGGNYGGSNNSGGGRCKRNGSSGHGGRRWYTPWTNGADPGQSSSNSSGSGNVDPQATQTKRKWRDRLHKRQKGTDGQYRHSHPKPDAGNGQTSQSHNAGPTVQPSAVPDPQRAKYQPSTRTDREGSVSPPVSIGSKVLELPSATPYQSVQQSGNGVVMSGQIAHDGVQFVDTATGAPVDLIHAVSADKNRLSSVTHLVLANRCRAIGDMYARSNDPHHAGLAELWYGHADRSEAVAADRAAAAAMHDSAIGS
jgi:hypothetical protein